MSKFKLSTHINDEFTGLQLQIDQYYAYLLYRTIINLFDDDYVEPKLVDKLSLTYDQLVQVRSVLPNNPIAETITFMLSESRVQKKSVDDDLEFYVDYQKN